MAFAWITAAVGTWVTDLGDTFQTYQRFEWAFSSFFFSSFFSFLNYTICCLLVSSFISGFGNIFLSSFLLCEPTPPYKGQGIPFNLFCSVCPFCISLLLSCLEGESDVLRGIY